MDQINYEIIWLEILSVCYAICSWRYYVSVHALLGIGVNEILSKYSLEYHNQTINSQ